MDKTMDTQNPEPTEREKISSEDLAGLIVDALLCASIVKQEDVQRAIKIATEEIEVRKDFGDY
jgi:hypothetical protein